MDLTIYLHDNRKKPSLYALDIYGVKGETVHMDCAGPKDAINTLNKLLLAELEEQNHA